MNSKQRVLLASALLLLLLLLGLWPGRLAGVTGTVTPDAAQSPEEPNYSAENQSPAEPRLNRARDRQHLQRPVPSTVEKLDPDRLGEPGYRARVWRSRYTMVYLKSPIRHSPEMQRLAELCQAYGYGPWAVAPAYWIAYENRRKEEMMQAWPDVGRENRKATEDIQEMLLEGRIVDHAQRLNVVAWDSRFIEEVRKLKPREFIGHQAFEFMGDDLLRDQLTWDEVDTE